jgi:hypothetical protein
MAADGQRGHTRQRHWGQEEGGDGCIEEETDVSAGSWRRRLRLQKNEKMVAPGPRRIGGVEEKVEVAG